MSAWYWIFHKCLSARSQTSFTLTKVSEQALEWGYSVDFCEPNTSWRLDPYELEKYNSIIIIHKVNNEIELFKNMTEWFSFYQNVQLIFACSLYEYV